MQSLILGVLIICIQADTFIQPKETTGKSFLFPGIQVDHSVLSIFNWIVLVPFSARPH